MHETERKQDLPRRIQARLLAEKTGVSEEQILELMELIGSDRASLRREIDLIKRAGQ